MALDVLYWALALLTVGYVPLAWAMVQAAREKPAIWALTLFTYLTVTIAGVVLAYVLAVANLLIGSPVPIEITRTVLRLFLLPLAIFPYLFWWVYRSGRFGDGEK